MCNSRTYGKHIIYSSGLSSVELFQEAARLGIYPLARRNGVLHKLDLVALGLDGISAFINLSFNPIFYSEKIWGKMVGGLVVLDSFTVKIGADSTSYCKPMQSGVIDQILGCYGEGWLRQIYGYEIDIDNAVDQGHTTGCWFTRAILYKKL